MRRPTAELLKLRTRLLTVVGTLCALEVTVHAVAQTGVLGNPPASLWIALDALQAVLILGILWCATAQVRRLLGQLDFQNRSQTLLANLNKNAFVGMPVADLERSVVDALHTGLRAHWTLVANFETQRVHLRSGETHEQALLRDFDPTALINEVRAAEPNALAVRDSSLLSSLMPVVPEDGRTVLARLVRNRDRTHGVLVAAIDRDAYTTLEDQFLRGTADFLNTAINMQQLADERAQTEALFRRIAENITDVFYVVDPPCERLYYVNPAYERIWGRSCASLQADPMSWLESIHPDDRPAAVEAVPTMKEFGYFNKTYRVTDAEGKLRWIRDRSYPIVNDRGEMVQVAGLATDISAIKEADEMRLKLALASEQKAVEAARSDLRARDDILAMVSHDLRGPLTSISMSAERLLKSTSTGEGNHRSLERMRRSAEHMNRLIEDLLDVTRLREGKLSLDTTLMSAAALLQETHDTYADISAGAGIELSVEVADDLPALQVDRTRILQVFGNLVGNAIKFTPAGGSIRLAAVAHAGGARLDVSDSGRGIPADELPKLFLPFWQRSTNEKRGLGLGLPIAKNIVEAHGGRIEVSSKEGEGTTFSVFLRRHSVMEEAPVHSQVSGEQPSPMR